MIVVDTNVICYRWMPSPNSAAAENALVKDPHWIAPLLWRSEFRNMPLQIVQRFKGSILPSPHELFSVFLAQSVYDAKSETHRVVIDDSAVPIGLQYANRFHVYTVPLRILHNRCRRVKAHRLIVNKAGVKFRCAMHF